MLSPAAEAEKGLLSGYAATQNDKQLVSETNSQESCSITVELALCTVWDDNQFLQETLGMMMQDEGALFRIRSWGRMNDSCGPGLCE